MEHSVRLRPARASDADLLLQWRNRPDVVAMSASRTAVDPDEHYAWFSAALDDPDILIRIAVDEQQTALGMVRANRDGNEASVSMIIDASAQGRGIGRRLMLLIEEQVQDLWPEVTLLVSHILVDNIASRKMVEAVGHKPVLMRYEKAI